MVERICSVPGCGRAGKMIRGLCGRHYQRVKLGMADPLALPLTREQLFWAKVAKAGPDDCWEWTAARDTHGYGQFWNPERRTMDLAHRVAFVLSGGWLPPVLVGDGGSGAKRGSVLVLHHCDNPLCCNPAHLSTGTHWRNAKEAWQRGRISGRGGERNGRAKLSAEQVAEMRARSTGRFGEQTEFAREYGLTSATVSKILSRQTWT